MSNKKWFVTGYDGGAKSAWLPRTGDTIMAASRAAAVAQVHKMLRQAWAKWPDMYRNQNLKKWRFTARLVE